MMERTPSISNCTKKTMAAQLSLLADEHQPIIATTTAAATDSTDKLLSLTSTSSSNYHSLDSLISSASRDECDEADDNEMATKRDDLQRLNSGGYSGSREEVDDEVFSSVNPIARLRGSRRKCPSTNNTRINNPLPPPPPPPPQQQQQQQQQPPNSDTAILTLLHEMRALEQQLQHQTATHANERDNLRQQLTQSTDTMKQLQQENETIRHENASLKLKMSTILSKLDNFATKCWQFNSASVKKMSEALHIQVHEWSAKLAISDNITSTVTESSSPAEEEAMRSNIMDKLQSMHLEIHDMKSENRKLRMKMKRYQKKMGMLDDVSDEVSHLSGVTQMTSATSMTTMTTSTTTRLMDAMAGFLNEHEGKCGGESGSSNPSSMKKKNTSMMASTSSLSPPQSILKSTFKYDNNTSNEQRGISSNSSLSEQPQGVINAPKVSQSSNTPLVSMGTSIIGSGSSFDQTNSGRRRPSTQKQVNFANFDNALFENVEFQMVTDNENHRLSKPWGGEEREV
ncbi:hypothetical protein ACHAWU_004139 [Discostella pseudostelligera]|uniref:Uncharacterized protein n=1 Tax=Discostella pseudostelligera TaxID=259834 RepID=A0ABD3MSP8_9STRA